MDHLRRGNKNLIKDLNKALVIDQVRRFGPMSRKEIALNTSLGTSTVTYIVDSLLKENFFQEIGTWVSSGGRRPVLLKFNARRSYVIGIKIEKTKLIFAKLDLNATIYNKEVVSFPRYAEADVVKQLIKNQVKKWLNEEPNIECSGVGIATSGIINQAEKRVLFSPILLWKDVSFTDLESELQLPIYLDNDANAFALAEIWRRENPYENFICITIGEGVGAGIVIKNEVYRGEIGGAGELGHIIIHLDGLPCYCGQQGCLEAHTSDQYILDRAKQILKGINTNFDIQENEITHEQVLQAAKSGHPQILDLYRRVGRDLGIGIKNMINLFNPGAIILGGEGLRAKEYILPSLKEEIVNNFFSPHTKNVEFILTDLGEEKWLIGAGSIVINKLFKEPLYREV